MGFAKLLILVAATAKKAFTVSFKKMFYLLNVLYTVVVQKLRYYCKHRLTLQGNNEANTKNCFLFSFSGEGGLCAAIPVSYTKPMGRLCI